MGFRFETARERWDWFRRQAAGWMDEPAHNMEDIDNSLAEIEQAYRIRGLVDEMQKAISGIVTNDGVVPLTTLNADGIMYSALSLIQVLEEAEFQPGDRMFTNFGPKPVEEAVQILIKDAETIWQIAKEVSEASEDPYLYQEYVEPEDYDSDGYYNYYTEVPDDYEEWEFEKTELNQKYRRALDGILMAIATNYMRSLNIDVRSGNGNAQG